MQPASASVQKVWRREPPDRAGFWFSGWVASKTKRMPWCVARNYFSETQIASLKFPPNGWYAEATGPEDKTPPDEPESKV